VLDWGPQHREPSSGALYEPHRHPTGAEIGRRLALRPGRYRIRIEAGDLGGPPPVLRVSGDSPGAPARDLPLSRVPGGFTGSLIVPAAERAVSLRLTGGGPLELRQVELE